MKTSAILLKSKRIPVTVKDLKILWGHTYLLIAPLGSDLYNWVPLRDVDIPTIDEIESQSHENQTGG